MKKKNNKYINPLNTTATVLSAEIGYPLKHKAPVLLFGIGIYY